MHPLLLILLILLAAICFLHLTRFIWRAVGAAMRVGWKVLRVGYGLWGLVCVYFGWWFLWGWGSGGWLLLLRAEYLLGRYRIGV